jgi:hypothetical protein
MRTDIRTLDSDDRQTLCEMTLADPLSGQLAREYLDVCTEIRDWSPDRSALELITWLILVREACGIEGVGHG